MEKRVFVAVLLSFVFLFAWAGLVRIFFPQIAAKKEPAAVATSAGDQKQTPPQPASQPASNPPAAAATPAPAVAAPVASPSVGRIAAEREQRVVVENDLYRAVFSNRGAQLISFQLKNYREKDGANVELVRSRAASRSDFPFAIESADAGVTAAANRSLYTVDDATSGSQRVITFRFSEGPTSLSKKFTFRGEYLFDFNIEASPNARPYRVIVGPGIKTLTREEKENKLFSSGNAIVQREDKLEVVRPEKAARLSSYDGAIDYAGIEDNYFLSVLKLSRGGSAVVRAVQQEGAKKDDKRQRELYVAVNDMGGAVAGNAFFGPKEATLLEKHGLAKALQFGRFGFIVTLLLRALQWVFTLTKNYGWAIIVLTLIIKILLYPLQHKSMVSMKKMQKLQPKVNSLKEKYKKAKTDPDQRQKLNTEMMKLYQVEGVSPMSGCLPIVMQLPILYAFYSLLSHAIELRGAPWIGWIHDLSAKDPYYITPLLMTVTMVIQQQITPSTADPVQKKMFMMMPLVFGFIFKDFPSGLVLYWLVQNILTIVQQLITNRYWK